MHAFTKISITSVALTLALSASRTLASMNPAADFSIVSNPSLDWTYGFYNQAFPTSGFFPDTIGTPGLVDQWTSPFGMAGVQYNTTGVNQLIPDGVSQARYSPHELGLAPGPNAQVGTLRYTAPAAGTYTLNLLLEGLNISGATNDVVFLLHNSVIVTSTPVAGFAIPIPLNASLILNAGDTLDVGAGWGTTGGPFGDNVGLENYQLTYAASIPEPATLSLLAVTGATLMGRRHRRS